MDLRRCFRSIVLLDMTNPFRNRLLMTSIGGFYLKRLLSVLVLSLSLAPFAWADLDLRLLINNVPNYHDTGFPSGIQQTITVGDWTLSLTPTSNSPTLTPFGLDLTLTAVCSQGSACGHLKVVLSDNNFTTPVSALTATYGANVVSGSGTTTGNAYESSTNRLEIETSLIPNGPGGPAAGPNPYSLTLDEVFNPTGSGTTSFSAEGQILAAPVAAVPEPASIALLGGVLLFTGSRLRKRFR
jgi:hypothetical protein